jgi:hypothetical protein
MNGALTKHPLGWETMLDTCPLVRQVCSHMDENAHWLSMLSIIRNMTFETANEIYVAHSATVMRHLCLCLANPVGEAASYAFDILFQVSVEWSLQRFKIASYSAISR